MTPAPPATNFDRVAGIYRWSEYLALGRLLEQIRFHYLPQLAGRTRAHVLGDGDGRFLARLLAAAPELQATAIDTSASFLSMLRQRCLRSAPNAARRLETLHASAFEIDPKPGTDLIVTHFFFDLFSQTQVEALVQRLGSQVQPGCLWLVSDFEVPRTPLLRIFGAIYIRALYFAFRALTGLRVSHLPDPQNALAASGFARIERHERCCGLLYTELWIRQCPRPSGPLTAIK